MSLRHYLRQPRVGEVIETRVGPATVTKVTQRGLVLDVVDEIGRSWTVERSSTGWWVRAVAA